MLLKRRRAPERLKHRQGLLRLFAFGTGVGIVCAGFSVRAARAEVTDQAMVAGRQLMTLANTDRGEAHKIVLNGQPVFFANAISEDSPATVLARYEENCKKNAAQSPEVWKEVYANAAKNDPAQAVEKGGMAETGGILRGGNADEGTIMCFVRSEQSKPTLGEALKSLQETGELGALGMLRYVYVKKTKKGGAHVLAAWTLEKFNLKELMPPEGTDVAGQDFPDVGRPDDSVRTLSAHVDGTPFGVNVYESGTEPKQVVAAYDASMIKKGWFALDLESAPKRNDPRLKNAVARIYEHDGAMYTVVASIENGKTVTAVGLAGNAAHEMREE